MVGETVSDKQRKQCELRPCALDHGSDADAAVGP